MYDLISIGNISIDLFFKGDSLTFDNGRFQLAIGGKYFTDYFHTSVGGGGANVAIGVSKLGLKTAMLGKIGDNSFKKIITDQLKLHKISTVLNQLEPNYTNVSCILVTPKGEKSVIHYSSPHQHIFSDNSLIQKLINTKMIYLGNLPDVAFTERERLLHLLKKNAVTTVVNLGIRDCRKPKLQLEEYLKPIDILILNGHEFAELVKANYKDIHFIDDVIRWYIPHLKEKLVVVTEGEKGSFAYKNGIIYHQVAVKPEHIVDTTGAGDGYTAGFIAEFLRSKNIQKSMEKGAHYAARILAKIGAN